MKWAIYFLFALSLFMQAHATKIIAREIVRVNPYDLRSDSDLCSGIAIEIGNSYLQTGTLPDRKSFCTNAAKKRRQFPASECNLDHMVFQCLQQIEKRSMTK